MTDSSLSSPTADLSALKALAADGRIEDLESAWLQACGQETAPAEAWLDVLAALPEEFVRASAPPMLGVLVDALAERGASADVLAIVPHLLALRVSKSDELEPTVMTAIENLYGGEEWYTLFLHLSGLRADDTAIEPGPDLGFSDALELFERLCRLLPGRAVLHGSGWGDGLVIGLDVRSASMTVRFRDDGAERSMPFTSGLDVLVGLPDHDLRARILTDHEGLVAEAAESPSHLVRAVARLIKGRAAAKDVKEWLHGTVIEPRSWNSWWRKAKAAALQDPWLAVDNPQRPVFVLRKRALTPEEEMADKLDRANGLENLLDVVRGPLSLDPPEGLRDVMLEHLATAIGATEEEDVAGAPARAEMDVEATALYAEAALLLVRHGARTQEWGRARVDELIDERRLFTDVTSYMFSAQVRREFLEVFAGARPQLWSDSVIGYLPQLASGLLLPVSDRLVAEGRGDALANRFRIFLLAPSRQPATTVTLSKRFAAGKFEDVEGAPTVVAVGHGLLRLAETQAPKAERDDKPAKALMKTLMELMVSGKSALLAPFVEAGTRSDLESALSLVTRVKTMPDILVAHLVTLVGKRFPDLAPRDEVPFWEQRGIFCTRAGITRYEEEYRVLLEEKIPENSLDIGRAAAYGDLSENFEWTAAIEQQRQLTEKAAAMEAELRLAQDLEDQGVEGDVVAPGTRVDYTEGGEAKRVTILGPWDKADDVVSYRAPLAAGMLGASVGDALTLELPAGPTDVIITGIEKVL